MRGVRQGLWIVQWLRHDRGRCHRTDIFRVIIDALLPFPDGPARHGSGIGYNEQSGFRNPVLEFD